MKTYYVRLLSYDEAIGLIDFINNNGGYANIVVGGVRVEIENKSDIYNYCKDNDLRFEINEEHPNSTVANIVKQLKETGEI